MRKTMFRGKAKMSIEELNSMCIEHHDGWIYGNLIQNGSVPYIVGDIIDSSDDYIAHEYWVSVHPESVGQFTGLLDIEEKEIYEGDEIKKVNAFGEYLGEIVFHEGAFQLKTNRYGISYELLKETFEYKDMGSTSILSNRYEVVGAGYDE